MAETKPQTTFQANSGVGTESRGTTTVGKATTQSQPTFSVGPIQRTPKAAPPTIAPKSANPTVAAPKTAPAAGPAPQNPPKSVGVARTPALAPSTRSSNRTARGVDPLQTLKNQTVSPAGAAQQTIRPAGPAPPTLRPTGTAAPTASATAGPGRTTMACEVTMATSRPSKSGMVPARNFEETKTMGRFEYSIAVKPEKPVFYKGQTWLTLFIFNTSKFRLCFRILPPDPNYFTVYPLSGFIDAGKSSYVAIKRLDPSVYVLDALDVEFGPDTGVQQAAILFEDAYCDYDRRQVPIVCSAEEEPKKTKPK